MSLSTPFYKRFFLLRETTAAEAILSSWSEFYAGSGNSSYRLFSAPGKISAAPAFCKVECMCLFFHLPGKKQGS